MANVSPPASAPAWRPPTPGEVDAAAAKDDWVHQLPPLDMGGWGDPHAAAMPDHMAPPPSQDSNFLRWIISGGDDGAGGGAMDDDDHPDIHLDRMLPRHHPPLGPGHGLPFTLAGDDAKAAAAPFRSLPLLQQQQPHAYAAFPSFDAHPAKRQQHPMAVASSPKLPPFAGSPGAGGFTASALKPKAEAAAGDDSVAAAAVDQLAEAAKFAEEAAAVPVPDHLALSWDVVAAISALRRRGNPRARLPQSPRAAAAAAVPVPDHLALSWDVVAAISQACYLRTPPPRKSPRRGPPLHCWLISSCENDSSSTTSAKEAHPEVLITYNV